MVNSLLTAIVRADGDALVMHVGERPYVVASSGPVELSSRPLTLEAVTGMLGQLLPFDARRALDELGAIEHELAGSVASHGDRFTVVAARGGDDIWIEVRRHRKGPRVAQPVVAPAVPAPTAAAPEPEPVVESTQVAQAAAAVEEQPPAPAPVEEVVAAAPPAAVEPAMPAMAAAPEPVVEPSPVAGSIAVSEPAPAFEPAPVDEAAAAPEPLLAAAPEPLLAAAPEPLLAAAAEPLVAAKPEPLVAAEPEALVSAAPEAVVAAPPEAEAPPAEPELAITVAGPEVAPAELASAAAAQGTSLPAAPVAAVPVMPSQPEVMSFEALVDASLRAAAAPAAPVPPAPAPAQRPAAPPPAPSPARPPARESIVRPLPATPIVERPPVESILFDEPVHQAPPEDMAPVSRPIAAQPEPVPAVVVPLARTPVRMEPQSRTQPSARIDRLLRLSAARGANTLYLIAQARPTVRVDGEIAVLEGEPALSASEVESLLLDLAPERTREALEAGEGTEWMSEVPEVGRIRCQSFRDHRGPGGIFRMISARPSSAEQLGLAREIQALCAEPEGLILVAGPRASGKSTLVSSLVDLINRTRNDYVITVEGEIKVVHESRGCLISQREVRGGNDDLAVAVRAAVRENPDVLVIDDMRSTEVVRLGLEAMEAGLLVIGGVSAHGVVPALVKVLGRAPMRLSLAEGLRGVVSQVLLRKTGGGRVAAREVLLNTPSVAKLIAEGRLSQLPLAIDSGRKHGMVPLNDALAAFVQSGVVDVKEAYRKAFERQAFLAVLRREGVDTSFAERLA